MNKGLWILLLILIYACQAKNNNLSKNKHDPYDGISVKYNNELITATKVCELWRQDSFGCLGLRENVNTDQVIQLMYDLKNKKSLETRFGKLIKMDKSTDYNNFVYIVSPSKWVCERDTYIRSIPIRGFIDGFNFWGIKVKLNKSDSIIRIVSIIAG